jgi:N-acyl homoserine lactone hydrolase
MKPFTFRTTTHPTTPADIGTPVSSSAMEALIDQPGPIGLKTVGSSWAAPLSGLLNLKDPKAVHAGLKNHKEPIQIYLHVLRHPTQGFFLIDTGVAEQFVKDPAAVGVGRVLRKYGGIQQMEGQPSTAAVIASERVPLKGVILSHIHLDHVSGLPDVPNDVPIYIGPNEANASLFLNLFAQGTNDGLLAGRPPLKEFQIPRGPRWAPRGGDRRLRRQLVLRDPDPRPYRRTPVLSRTHNGRSGASGHRRVPYALGLGQRRRARHVLVEPGTQP